MDDDKGLETIARFLGGELEPERRVAPLEVQDSDGLGLVNFFGRNVARDIG